MYTKLSEFLALLPTNKKNNLELLLGLPYYNYYVRRLKAQFDVNEIEINNVNLKNFLFESALQKVYITELYNDSIFFKSEQVNKFIKELGGEKINLKHFTTIEEFEDVMFGIIKEGVIVNYLQFLLLLELSYKQRIFKTILKDCIKGKILPKYDKRKNVPQVAADFRSLLRRIKDNPTKKRTKDEYEKLVTEFINKFNTVPKSEFNFIKAFDDIINLRQNNAEFKRQLLEMLTPCIMLHGKAKTKEIFKSYFYLIFENDNRYGLLNEKDWFESYKTKLGDVLSYNGNYKTYYNLKIKALVGI